MNEKENEVLVDENGFPLASKETIDAIEPTNKDYIDIFSEYNLPDEDIEKMLDLVMKYRKGDRFNLFNRLPKQMQSIVDGLRVNGTERISRENATYILLDSLINDAKFSSTVEEYNQNMAKTINEMNTEYDLIFSDAIDNIFTNIDKIRSEDPEKAESIEKIKAAFDDAASLSRINDYIDSGINMNKITKKATNRFEDATFFFNKKVSVTDIVFPDLNELVSIIKAHLPEYDELIIKKFIVIITASNLNPNMKDISTVAYLYKLVSNIYNYKFVGKVESEQYKNIFGNISTILDKIKNLS